MEEISTYQSLPSDILRADTDPFESTTLPFKGHDGGIIKFFKQQLIQLLHISLNACSTILFYMI